MDSTEASGCVANVPVKITIKRGDEIMDECEEMIDLEFSDTAAEGKRNIGGFRALATRKGYSTEQALFALAR